MPKITIAGLPGADGEYLLDLARPFTYRESHMIKEIAGVRALEMEEAMTAGDSDLIIALTKIALDRAGRSDVSAEMLMDAQVGGIQFGPTDEEAKADEEEKQVPPMSALETPDEPSSSATPSEPTTNGDSEVSPETGPRASGSLGLVASSPFGRAT